MKEALINSSRINTNSVKWDCLKDTFGEDGLIPLWVADMDFKCPQAVRDALSAWVEMGALGYYHAPDAYYNSFIRWQEHRHGYLPKREWLRYAPGVVPAVYWLVSLLTRPGDGVAVLTPVYYPFFGAIQDTGRKIVSSELINTAGVYTIDFADLERKIKDGGARALIFCSPHNPVGRVWRREEIERVCQICKKHGVAIISDEIHQDLVISGRHIPTALCSDEVFTATAASKTFNLAGLQNSFIIIPDDSVRERFDETAKQMCVQWGGAPGYIAVQAAYEHGHGWLESVLAQIRSNYAVLGEYMASVRGAVLSPLEGTYLAWLDLRACLPAEKIKEIVQDKCGLAVDFGDWFGGEQYAGFIRINLATPGENVLEAARRLKAELMRFSLCEKN